MAIPLKDPPYNTPMVDEAGRLSGIWIAWFREMFRRLGGNNALSNTELESLQTVDLDDISDDVEQLGDEVTELQDRLALLELGPVP